MSIYQVWIPGETGYKEHLDRVRVSNENINAIREQTQQLKNSIRNQSSDSADQAKRLIATNKQLISALDNGFNRLIEVNQRGFERVTSAIEAMHSDLVYLLGTIVQKLEYQNRILNDILTVIQAPFETKVREYYSKGCSLIDGGILDKAIEYLKQSIALPTGDIFFPSHYQLGRLYLSGVDEGVNVINLKLATEYLSLANKWGGGIYKAKGGGTTRTPKVGDIFAGTVKTLLPFGVFVEFLPNTIGLLHVSEISNEKSREIDDIFKVGDKIKVKLSFIDQSEGKFKLTQKSISKDTPITNISDLDQRSSNPFGSILADCKFFLSQSYWFQLTGQTNEDDLDLLDNAIKYCKEAISLNFNLSQGYYHLAKYYAYRMCKFKDYQNNQEVEQLIVSFNRAVMIDRNYLRTVVPDDLLFDPVFIPTKKYLIENIANLTNSLKNQTKEILDTKGRLITKLEDMNISRSSNLSTEFSEAKQIFELAWKDFQTGTYFGYDDCQIKLENI